MLEVTDVRAEALDVMLVELRRGGGALEPFTPGGHLEIELPNGLIRRCSLTNEPADRSILEVLEANGGAGAVLVPRRTPSNLRDHDLRRRGGASRLRAFRAGTARGQDDDVCVSRAKTPVLVLDC